MRGERVMAEYELWFKSLSLRVARSSWVVHKSHERRHVY
jgi:hypothetical protein